MFRLTKEGTGASKLRCTEDPVPTKDTTVSIAWLRKAGGDSLRAASKQPTKVPDVHVVVEQMYPCIMPVAEKT